MTNPINSGNSSMLIRKPIQEVFDAFIYPEVTTKFWFTHSSTRLEEGKSLIWTWKMYDLDVPVTVKKIELNKSIIIEWGEGKQKSKVKWEFKSITENATYVTITYSDFQGEGDELIRQIIDSTGGFTMVIAGLKAWMEHGVQLNLIGDKFPKEMRG